MKIIKLILRGCYRLELSSITEIEIDFTKIGNVLSIIGTNGSGKSSLLHYLSPLPADKVDFTKNGYKEIVIEHLGNTYKLINDFKENKHSFIDLTTSEELNIGGTITYQTQLVKGYFNYTKEIHALLTDKEYLTRLSPQKRKEWFTLLCDTDYTYAFSVFNKAKERLRDTIGALKKTKQQLVSVSQGNLESEDLMAINKTIRDKEEEIEYLNNLVSFSPEMNDPDYLEDLIRKQGKNNQELVKWSKDLYQTSKEVYKQYIRPEDLQDILKNIEHYKHESYSHSNRYRTVLESYTETENKLLEINQLRSTSLEDLLKAQTEIQAEIEGFEIDKHIERLEYPESLLKQLNAQYNEINRYIEESLKIESETLSYRLLKQYQEEVDTLNHSINQSNVKIAKITERIHSIKEKERQAKVECPNCHHEFHLGYSKEALEKLNLSLTEEKEKLSTLTRSLKEKQSIATTLNRDIEVLKQLLTLLSSFNGLFSPLIQEIKEKKLYQNGSYLYSCIDRIKQGLKDKVKKNELLLQLKEIEEKIKNLNGVDEKYRLSLEETLMKLEKESIELKEKLAHFEKRQKILEDKLHCYQVYDDYKRHVTDKVAEQEKINFKIIEKDLYDTVHRIVVNLREEIALLSKKQISLAGKQKQIELLENTVKSLEEERVVFQAIIEALNPQDGLIAEGLLGYIKIFLARLNGFIASIWSYPLIVHPSKVETGEELSYRFPITVGHSNHLKPDVSLGSDGIREIINLAFKFMVMKSLKLDNYPLYLDEPGRTFDAKHRENVIKLIERLAEEFPDNQIFLISHSFMEYSVLSDIVYCVISEDNIVLPPSNINTGITITRQWNEWRAVL